MTPRVDRRHASPVDPLAASAIPTAVGGIPPDPLTEPATTSAACARLSVVDKLRGLVIVIMVLDHVRDFFHVDAYQFSPTDLGKTSAFLFATRWITHVCAPTFVFLAGVAIYLQWSRGKRGRQLSAFLLTRGVWLIVLEVTLVTVAFTMAWDGALLQVIWAIGFSMILLGTLVWLPPAALLAIGLVIVCGHDLLVGTDAKSFGIWAPIWTLMVKPGLVHLPSAHFGTAYVAYPAIPWFGIMALGYGVGQIFERPPPVRDAFLAWLGVAMLVAFVLLRAFNLYGDASPWSTQSDTTRTILSVLKVTKYPPSLLYTLVTLGITISLVPLIERIDGLPGRVLLVFGRTPLFTYLLHLYVARALAILLALAEGLSPAIFTDAFDGNKQLATAGWGVSLPWVYLAWISVLLILWPLSTWFAALKGRRRSWWLSYL